MKTIINLILETLILLLEEVLTYLVKGSMLTLLVNDRNTLTYLEILLTVAEVLEEFDSFNLYRKLSDLKDYS